MRKIVFIITLITLIYTGSAQFIYPDESRLELLFQSEQIKNCRMFRNNLCNAFILFDDGYVCSIGERADSIPLFASFDLKNKYQDIVCLEETLVLSLNNEIISIPVSSNDQSTTPKTKTLFNCKEGDLSIYYSTPDHFFIVTRILDEKHKPIKSSLFYYAISNDSMIPLLDANGSINCVVGDSSTMCIAVDSNLIIVNNEDYRILVSESEPILSVTKNLYGVFYCTANNVYYTAGNNQKFAITPKGARQLISNCNILYMILNDGSLIRILNSAAYYKLFYPSNNEQ